MDGLGSVRGDPVSVFFGILCTSSILQMPPPSQLSLSVVKRQGSLLTARMVESSSRFLEGTRGISLTLFGGLLQFLLAQPVDLFLTMRVV